MEPVKTGRGSECPWSLASWTTYSARVVYVASMMPRTRGQVQLRPVSKWIACQPGRAARRCGARGASGPFSLTFSYGDEGRGNPHNSHLQNPYVRGRMRTRRSRPATELHKRRHPSSLAPPMVVERVETSTLLDVHVGPARVDRYGPTRVTALTLAPRVRPSFAHGTGRLSLAGARGHVITPPLS